MRFSTVSSSFPVLNGLPFHHGIFKCALFIGFVIQLSLFFLISFFFLLSYAYHTLLFRQMDSINSNDSNSIRHLHKILLINNSLSRTFLFIYLSTEFKWRNFVFFSLYHVCVNLCVCFRCCCHTVVTAWLLLLLVIWNWFILVLTLWMLRYKCNH